MLCKPQQIKCYVRQQTSTVTEGAQLGKRWFASPKREIPDRNSPVSLWNMVIKGFVDTFKGKIHLDC